MSLASRSQLSSALENGLETGIGFLGLVLPEDCRIAGLRIVGCNQYAALVVVLFLFLSPFRGLFGAIDLIDRGAQSYARKWSRECGFGRARVADAERRLQDCVAAMQCSAVQYSTVQLQCVAGLQKKEKARQGKARRTS